MVSQTLQRTVDALSVEDRVGLLEYLERTTAFTDTVLTEDQLAMIARRDAEMDADPLLGVSEEEFMSTLRARWT
ncbi:MAG: hypothetical protein LBE83_07520 [Propionibacteriaceae bacterium]|jgi:putative addiction module component (TIGR02574 family)|nr:hypothetical protein [Propionibacteriaceae bacterium]